MIKVFTIGFTGKSARTFFGLLEQNGVKKIIDTRISNNSQLAGFAKGADLAFFAERIGGIDYEHRLEFAPTRELLDAYRNKKMTWDAYTTAYLGLLEERHINTIDIASLDEACLLCSEHLPTQCHRRLLAEYLQQIEPTIEIIHLQ
jgi:uncharacterized protein (DUF488 family)